MYLVPTQQMSTARNMARSAQQEIKNKTGMGVTVLVYPTEHHSKTPQRMLHVIALALDMNPEYYRTKTRVREVVELRFLASLFLRQNFPALTLQQIAAYFGQDHTSIMNGLSKAYSLLYVEDNSFVKKYKVALKAVEQWMQREG